VENRFQRYVRFGCPGIWTPDFPHTRYAR